MKSDRSESAQTGKVKVGTVLGVVGLITTGVGFFLLNEPGYRWEAEVAPVDAVEVGAVCSGYRPSAPGNETIAICSESTNGRRFYIMRGEDERFPYQTLTPSQDGFGSDAEVQPEDGDRLKTFGHRCENGTPQDRVPAKIYTCKFKFINFKW